MQLKLLALTLAATGDAAADALRAACHQHHAAAQRRRVEGMDGWHERHDIVRRQRRCAPSSRG